MHSTTLIAFSGLPGTGKTTIAIEVARAIGATFLRIDSVEQALRNEGLDVAREGYAVAYAVAEDSVWSSLADVGGRCGPRLPAVGATAARDRYERCDGG